MHGEVNRFRAPHDARHEPVGELSAWVFYAALLMFVFSIAAVAVACGVVLIVT